MLNFKVRTLHLFLSFALLFEPAVFSQIPDSLQTGLPPHWASWESGDEKPAASTSQYPGGQVLALFDTQVNPSTSETFVHLVKEITSDSGLQTGANLEFVWDPSYQSLIIHEIKIRRGSELINRLDLSKFKIIQQETDLNRQIYNGALSAILFLEDIRVGDRIDYTYTVQGHNPSLKSRYVDSFLMGWGVPVLHRRVRLLWPETRSFKYRQFNLQAEPGVRSLDEVREFVWDVRNAPPIVAEDQVPSWFIVYPFLQMSEFGDWSEVARWASSFYVATNLNAPELNAVITTLRKPGASPEQIIQGALEFAQNDIRYLGIEFGPNSYHPTDPVAVLQRRFGDCKDKAYLLCTLLQRLGFDAAPVLVSTSMRHMIVRLLPSPHDFDHVIVRVSANGKVYWLDPTRSFQRGPIDQRNRPDYGYGLVARSGETNLSAIPLPPMVGMADTLTAESFDVGGQKEPVQLNVSTTFKGFDAEWIRAVLAGGGQERVAKMYLNDYAQRYPAIREAAPMTVEDIPNADTLVLNHSYSISNFWVLTQDKQRFTGQFYPLGIHSWLMPPNTALRSMPMELSYPKCRAVKTQVRLPHDFGITNSSNVISGPGAQLSIQRSCQDNMLHLDYEFQTLTNFVPAASTAEHIGSLNRMENALGYVLLWQNLELIRNTSQFNWPIFLLAVFYTGAFGVGLSFLYRYRTRPDLLPILQPPYLGDPALKGLKGWLILVGCGLVLRLIILLRSAGVSIESFTLWRWQTLTSPGGLSYHPGWAPILIGEALLQISLFILNLFLLFLFFQKRRIFPRWFIGMMLLSAVYIVGDAVAVQCMKPTAQTSAHVATAVFQVLIPCAIWIPYMCVSRRVKTTFIR